MNIAADRYALGRALALRVAAVATRMERLPDAWPAPEGAPDEIDDVAAEWPARIPLGNPRPDLLADVRPASALDQVLADGVGDRPIAVVAFRGERIERPPNDESPDGQLARQAWTVAVVAPMDAGGRPDAGLSLAGPIVSWLERRLRSWCPPLDGCGPLVRVQGDPPEYVYERRIVAIDLRYESRIEGA